jgi:hypothetical protein
MSENPGRRRNIPADPTAEPASEPVPTGEDVIGREENQRTKTPPRDGENADDVVMPSDDSTLNTQI